MRRDDLRGDRRLRLPAVPAADERGEPGKRSGRVSTGSRFRRWEVFTLPQTGAAINPAVSVPLLDFYTRKRLVYREAGTPPPPGSRPRRCVSPGKRRRRATYAAPAGAAPATAVVVICKHARPDPAAAGFGVAQRHIRACVLRSLGRRVRASTLVVVYRRAQDH